MPKDKAPRSALRRRLAWGSGALGVLGVGAWVLVHSTSWAGPLAANALRIVIGTDNVAKLEDFVYAIEDRIQRVRMRGEKPKAHWTVPATKPQPAAAAAVEPGSTAPVWPRFEPKSVGPVHKRWFAPGDGEWVAIEDPRHPNAPIVMYKTLVHPDANRSWGELFVITLDLEQSDLRAVAGTHEPKAEPPVGKEFARPGRVPLEDQESLLAAFNGGFMAEHGHYGMLVQGVTLIKPRDPSCTVVGYVDGTVEIATWKSVAHASERMSWFRQTPACMYENGTMHLGLRYPETRNWGATLDGDTVIRRSAIGLDASRRVLFVGIGNHMTARALAEGMHHVGAVDVAQLDVNWSYPKFLTYAHGKDGKLEARAAMDGFEFSPGEYVSKSSFRDFFYLTRRKLPRTARLPAQSTQRPPEVEPAASAVPVASAGPAASVGPGAVGAATPSVGVSAAPDAQVASMLPKQAGAVQPQSGETPSATASAGPVMRAKASTRVDSVTSEESSVPQPARSTSGRARVARSAE